MDIQKLKRQFLEYIEIERGRSLKTVENYERYLNRFFDFIQVKDPKDITDDVVREFRLYLNRQPGAVQKGVSQDTMKKKTQNYYLITPNIFIKMKKVNFLIELEIGGT